MSRNRRSLAALAIAPAVIVGSLLALSGQASGEDSSSAPTRQMQESQVSFSLQYLQLQNAAQNQNRQHTMVSDIMKTKHDTVKNSISNIR
jgi:hypothetical protein